MIFKKKITQEDVDKWNTINALTDHPLVKVCVLCKHHFREHSYDKCARDRIMGFNSVTGKPEVVGRTYFCEHNRELDDTYSIAVENGDLCGAIGQFWEPIEPKQPKPGFWDKWFKKKLDKG